MYIHIPSDFNCPHAFGFAQKHSSSIANAFTPFSTRKNPSSPQYAPQLFRTFAHTTKKKKMKKKSKEGKMKMIITFDARKKREVERKKSRNNM
jgi:hypothetical protein